MSADGKYLLAIDQGTSSSRAVLYDHETRVVASAQQEFPQHYPQPGWVEHDPEDIWRSVEAVVRETIAEVDAAEITGIGITNQRETTVIWERGSGRPIHNAIVWQDRRTADRCEELRGRGAESDVTSKTGLKLDPYFSATKIAWLLDNVDGARQRAENGELAFGTIDTFLLWRLTDGVVHATDATNASRTLLFDIHDQRWDADLCELFRVPEAVLPEVFDCAADFGTTSRELFGAELPVCGVAGDQQAALIGQSGFANGTTKSTYGTGCFVIANTGNQALTSHNQLLTTVANRLDGQVTYGLEGSVFVAGSAVQWLRDELGLIASASETEAIARETGVVEDVVVVPAFAGLGAPYWDPHARGAVLGLTRGSGRNEVVTATLQAIALQTFDLVDAMADDGIRPSVIRVDGGMVGNDWFLQFLADILDIAVERPENVESTVLGAAYLAALARGVIASIEATAGLWQCERRFEPQMQAGLRDRLLAGWAAAINRARSRA